MSNLSEICLKCALAGRPRIQTTPVMQPDILFIGGYPLDFDIQRGPFMGRNSSLLRKVIETLQNQRGYAKRIIVDYAYACECAPAYDNEAKKFNINAEIVNLCATNLKMRIDRTQPKVLVALGADALRALDFHGKPSDFRGGIYSFKRSDGVALPVIATFHVVAVNKSPGLLPTFQKDLNKAFVLAQDGLTDTEMELQTPTSVEAILAELQSILDKATVSFKENGRKLGLAVDTETTSLQPYRQDDRVIMISMSYQRGQGLAYPFEHKKCVFTEDEFAQIVAKTEEVLSSPYIAIIMANGKFDLQWLKYHYGLKINLLLYDVLLAEHVLDEDKKGEYSLKDITRDRFPSMGKYEEELKAHLQAVWSAKDTEIVALQEAHKEAVNKVVEDWWLNLGDEQERLKICTPWVAAGYVALSDVHDLMTVKYRKLRGLQTIPKKYREAVTRMMSNVPVSELSKYVTLPTLVIPEHLTVKTYEDADLHILLRYAAIDALTTRMICEDQQQDFAKEEKRIHRTEQILGYKLPTLSCSTIMNANTTPLCRCIAEMEYHGVRLDREKCTQYRQILLDKIAEAEDIMYTEVGRKFNTSSSSPDLAYILYDEKKLPVIKRTENGSPSTDAEVLKELSDNYDLPFLQKLLVYRKLDKCLHTYIENWLKMSEYDGKIHAEFNQIGTATYRLSSSNPNIQNVPFALKEAKLNLKSLFIPDTEDYDVYDLDISNAEMRVLTAYSQDKALTDAFNHGKDLHCLTAAGISEYSYDDIKAHKEDKTTDQYRKRQLAKKVNFGTIYCMSADRLQQQLWSELRIKESIEQCQDYLNRFFVTYPGVERYINETKNFVARFGYTWTFTGRRRRFAIAQYSRAQASRMGRQAVNARIQTTSSDLVMFNLIDLAEWLKARGGRIILTVHDSILFQLPKNIGAVMADLKQIITEGTATRAPWLPVEWKFDVGRGANYGDAHDEVS